MMAIQEKTRSYVEQTTCNDFILLDIEMYECFHFFCNSFLTTLCTYHYHMSSMVFFSPLDSNFLLLTAHVHNVIACASHSDFSVGYYI
jgi:hypothetical protein